MIEVERDDFFVESIKNPIEYGTYYKINPKYGTGFQWTSEVHHDFIITVTDIRFNQETMVGEHIGSGYVLALYISGAGDEFYPYQNISPNTLRCYEPSEKYKAIYHPQIPLRCITVQFDQEFIDQYLQEISGDLEVNFSDFFKEKGKFYLPNVNHAMQSLYEYLLSTIACMSESKMKKLFKSVYNMSITEYIQRKRISVAEHMLIQTDLTIAEISRIVGYSNPSRLIEIFKRYYGFTPSKYRK